MTQITTSNYTEKSKQIDFSKVPSRLKTTHEFALKNLDLYGKSDGIKKLIDEHLKQLNEAVKGCGCMGDGKQAKQPVKRTSKAKVQKAVSVDGKKKYPGVFGDYDGDGILNVDDPNPTQAGDKETVEEVKLSDEIAKLIDFRKEHDERRQEFVAKLKEVAEGETDILSRTKTPYSIINKMRRKMTAGPNQGLTDMVGTMVIFDNVAQLEDFKQKVNAGAMGKVVEFDDYYKKPKAGYRAYHWNVIYKGSPVEIQAKTERIKKIAGANHTLYKEGKAHPEKVDALMAIAVSADKGSKNAQKWIDQVLSNKAQLNTYLTTKKAPSLRTITGSKGTTRTRGVDKEKDQAKLEALRKEIEGKEDLTRAEVLRVAAAIHSFRRDWVQKKDEAKGGKKVLEPTKTNLIAWAKDPGRYDLIGIDAHGKTKPTTKARETEGRRSWWDKFWNG